MESIAIEWMQDLLIKVINSFGEPIRNLKCILIAADNKEQEGNTKEEGKIVKNDCIPGEYTVGLKFDE